MSHAHLDSDQRQPPLPSTDRRRRHRRTAGRQLLAAAAALDRPCRRQRATRYRYFGGQLVAIVQTGDDEFGLPDHAGAADLLGRMQQTRIPFGS